MATLTTERHFTQTLRRHFRPYARGTSMVFFIFRFLGKVVSEVSVVSAANEMADTNAGGTSRVVSEKCRKCLARIGRESAGRHV